MMGTLHEVNQMSRQEESGHWRWIFTKFGAGTSQLVHSEKERCERRHSLKYFGFSWVFILLILLVRLIGL
uniref:Transmembrane protein n=1 Tax=Brassica campestris TaxID=3711 RepID=A0A3P5YX79_BRACM|nr:unnamed protein product [Brassica rapa]